MNITLEKLAPRRFLRSFVLETNESELKTVNNGSVPKGKYNECS